MPPKKTKKSEDQRNPGRQDFRFQKNRVHLTYTGHLDHGKLIEHFGKCGGGWEWYSVVWETGKDGEYDHTHFAGKWKKRIDTCDPRYFDFDGVHPNIKYIGTHKHECNIWEYHKKEEGQKCTQSERGPIDTIDLVAKIQLADSLGDAIDIAGVHVKSVTDVVAIRNEKRKREIPERTYGEEDWSLKAPENWKVLFLYGATGTGKTEWAIHQFQAPLLVRHMDALRDYDSRIHDGKSGNLP